MIVQIGLLEPAVWRRRVWILIFGVLTASGLTEGCARPRGPLIQPNVLVIVVDCLRADRVGHGPAGDGLTPNLDRLASNGIRFSKAFAPATWTKPSVASLFTGLYPRQHGVLLATVGKGDLVSAEVLPANFETLAEHFQRGGYATGAFVNQVHLHPRFGFDQGFGHFENRRGRKAPGLNRKLLEWLSEDRQERPFFAYLHYLDAHWPYSRSTPTDSSHPWHNNPPPRRGVLAEEWLRTFPPDEQAAVVAELERLYDNEVRSVDAHVGDLLTRVLADETYRGTVVVVTSDHGEGFNEHGWLQHSYPPFEEVIHIPLIIRLPGNDFAGRVVPQPASLVDLLPTLTELAGLPEPSGVAGRSLVPLWQGTDNWTSRLLLVDGASSSGVRSQRFKLIVNSEGSEYYDLSVDPYESSPLGRGQCGSPCARLDQAMQSYRAQAEENLKLDAVPLTAEEVQDLKKLGYL